ncbi:unnamed protein product [Rotaria sp. Silwood1]|nr:unnamed protein product [Rotaria sp. Silwood1]
MISNNQYWNNMSSFDFDDLFLLSDDFNLKNEYNQFSMLHNNLIKEITSLSPEIDQDQQQTLSENNSTKKSQRSNLECRVCGAPAQGYNFDQITCESCKAFFRRNAFRDMSQIKCRFSDSCIINIHTRRQCVSCRLKKCFNIKMRKEWIRTEDEKNLRRLQKLAKEKLKTIDLSNDQKSLITSSIVRRRKKSLITKSTNQELVISPIYRMYHSGFNSILYDEDRTLINNINNVYQLAINKNDYSYINKYTSLTSFLQFINDESIMHESLVNFFKFIPEFKQIDINDKILLIKSNFINIIHLHRMIIYNFQECSNLNQCISKWIGKDFHYQMIRTRQYSNRFMNYPILLKLALAVFIFNVNLSASWDRNQFYEYQNQKILFEYQNYYINILWHYLNYLFDEKEAIKAMEIIVMQILRFQSLMVTLENFVRQCPVYEQFHSLMQSILGLT